MSLFSGERAAATTAHLVRLVFSISDWTTAVYGRFCCKTRPPIKLYADHLPADGKYLRENPAFGNQSPTRRPGRNLILSSPRSAAKTGSQNSFATISARCRIERWQEDLSLAPHRPNSRQRGARRLPPQHRSMTASPAATACASRQSPAHIMTDTQFSVSQSRYSERKASLGKKADARL